MYRVCFRCRRKATAMRRYGRLASFRAGLSQPNQTDVRCVPSLRDSLLSVGQLWSTDNTDCHFANIRTLEVPPDASGHRTLLPFIRRGGFFEWHVARRDPRATGCRMLAVHSSRATSHIQVMAANDAAHYMHRRLHCGNARLKQLADLTTDAPQSL
eukprot:2218961-Pleurochrysis_carterae.AAC.2